jgi:thioredoxin reductase (NADPH)
MKRDETPKKKTRYDVIIIGAGPAGYTAGIYCSRARCDTLILSGILPGGQLVNTTEVENYPGFEEGIMGPDLMISMRNQTKRMEADIVDDEVVNVDFKRRPFKVLTASEEYEARAVIIATGASPRTLGLEGEQTFGGRGVSYCATCDGPFFRNQEIVVVGGGDSAMEEATFLTKFAGTVHLVHRRDQFRASKIMQERALSSKKIRIHYSHELESITGDQKVQQVTLKSTKTGQTRDLAVGGVFVAVGHDPNTKLFAGQVEMDTEGYIAIKGNTQTSVEGVFAAGDVHDRRYRQAVTAAGFGCMAGIDVNNFLTENS